MHPENITGVNIITISPDGYIRLTFEEFQQVLLVHLMSGLDEGDNLSVVREGATFAEITGYTDWVSTTSPAISIGWDWTNRFSQVGGVNREVI